MFKTQPMDHQRHELETHGDHPFRALWWEMGTGKSKTCVDTMARLYRAGKIDAVLIISPGSVDAQWEKDEIPKHLPDDVAEFTRVFRFQTSKMRNKGHQAQLPDVLAHEGLSVLIMTYDAIMTERKKKDKPKFRYFGAEMARAFLGNRRVLYILDESDVIRTPGSKTSKRILASAKYAQFRRALNGTPVEDSPFHIYSQIQWVDPTRWQDLGISNYAQFRNYFGEWERRTRQDGRSFPSLVCHRNLDVLRRVIGEVGTRVMKEDVMDLPPKVYKTIYYDLSKAQSEAYRQLVDEYVVEFPDGATLEAEHAIQRITRMQQICSGYLPADEEWDEPMRVLDPSHPRLAALKDCVEQCEGQGIIWAKYNVDVELITGMLRDVGHTYLVYSAANRDELPRMFQAGKFRWMVAKQQSSANRGLTLTNATSVIYYNNNFRLSDRAQSEDRPHRRGQDKTVTYYDIVANGTVDEHILAVLRRKKEISQLVDPRHWV